jgi:hypothetical protein
MCVRALLDVVRYLVHEYPESLQVTNNSEIFILSLVHFCGRGSEVAVVQFHRIFLKTPSEFLDTGENRDQIAIVSLYRTKI